jgi:hypothetical protein
MRMEMPFVINGGLLTCVVGPRDGEVIAYIEARCPYCLKTGEHAINFPEEHYQTLLGLEGKRVLISRELSGEYSFSEVGA